MAERSARAAATVEDLYGVDSKAELIDGAIVPMGSTGDVPSYAASEIFESLREHGRRTGAGRAVNDNVGFVVDLPGRRTFSPDAAYRTGPPAGTRFFEGAPVFAVEVRSEGDYGPAAERAITAKRRDDFAAGTRAVRDVDLLDPASTVRLYRAERPDDPVRFGRGDVADAGDAVPDWSMAVDELFVPGVG